MNKSIDTLVDDIYSVLRNDAGGIELTGEQQAELGTRIAEKVARSLNRGERAARPTKTLYMSEIGKPCVKQVWYDHVPPELAEPLLPHTRFKFLYGDIIEEILLFLAKVSGHSVRGEQEKLYLYHRDWAIVGRRDVIIDDVLVDVKSASTYSFKKFKEGLDATNDGFGYRLQLDAYNTADALTNKGILRRSGWLVAEKQNGHIAFSEHTHPPENLSEGVDKIIDALENPGIPPIRDFIDVREGKSGNKKLDVQCSYCPYPVHAIDQGIEILAGVEAGAPDANGDYPDGTVHGLVDRELQRLAKGLRAFAAPEEKGEGPKS